MKVKVNKDNCIGCCACTMICPETFIMDDDNLAKAVNEEVTDDNKDDIESALDSCPGDAISMVEVTSNVYE